jgi:hypothetical protein
VDTTEWLWADRGNTLACARLRSVHWSAQELKCTSYASPLTAPPLPPAPMPRQSAISVLVLIMPDMAGDYPQIIQGWTWAIEWFSLVIPVSSENAAKVVATLASSPVGLETLVAHSAPWPRIKFLFPYSADATPLCFIPTDLKVRPRQLFLSLRNHHSRRRF